MWLQPWIGSHKVMWDLFLVHISDASIMGSHAYDQCLIHNPCDEFVNINGTNSSTRVVNRRCEQIESYLMTNVTKHITTTWTNIIIFTGKVETDNIAWWWSKYILFIYDLICYRWFNMRNDNLCIEHLRTCRHQFQIIRLMLFW